MKYSLESFKMSVLFLRLTCTCVYLQIRLASEEKKKRFSIVAVARVPIGYESDMNVVPRSTMDTNGGTEN